MNGTNTKGRIVAGVRRGVRWASVALFVLGVTAAAAALGTLGQRHAARLDLTGGGVHGLGPRAQRVVDQLDEGVEIVMALPTERVGRRSVDRVADVLDAFAAATDRVRVTRIDPGGPEGRARIGALLERLVERERDAIDSGRDAVRRGIERARSLSDDLLEERAGAGRNEAVLLRALSRELDGIADRALAQLDGDATGDAASDAGSAEDGSVARPPNPEAAAAPLRTAFAALHERLRSTADRLRAAGDSSPGGDGLARRLGSLADRAAAAREGLSSVRRPDAARVWDELSGGRGLVVLGEPGRGHSMSPIAPGRVLPNEAALRAAGVSALPRVAATAERLVSAAIASVSRDDTPILVVAHAEGRSGVGRLERLRGLIGRLRGRGIDTLLWDVLASGEPPSTVDLDPLGTRPVVYLALAPDTTAFGGGEGVPSGGERAEAMAEAVRTRSENGAGVLLSLGPSYLPTIGDTDPLAAFAERFGIGVGSGRVVLSERVGQGGARSIEIGMRARSVGDHPIADAVGELPARVEWAVPMTVELDRAAAGVRSWPLLDVDGGDRRWTETQWLSVWRALGRSSTGEVRIAGDVSFDAEVAGETRGPWTVAAAGERDGAGLERPSRAVVVGAWGWADDGLWSASAAVGGRVVRTNPGNIELIEASIEWLAGRDELIGRSAAGPPISRVDDLSAGDLGLLRWILLGGVPVGVLVLWAVVRLIVG